MTFNRRTVLLATLAGLAAPTAAVAETVTVTDIVTTGEGGFRIEIPAIEAVDANLDETAIRAMFSGADYSGISNGLAALDATSIRVPEIVVGYDLPVDSGATPKRAEITYYDFVLSNVVDGMARGASLGSIEIKGDSDTVITVGTISIDLLDLGGIFGFYGLGPEPRSDEMKPLYESFSMLGASVASPEFTCEVGAAAAERFSARPIKGSFDELMALTAEMQEAETSGETPSSETLSAFIVFYADFLTAFESTPTTVDGLSCYGTNDGEPLRITATGVSVGGFAPGLYPEFAVDDFRLEADDGWFEFGNFTWKPMDLNGPIAALLEAKDILSEEWFEQNWRKVIPAIEGFSLSGLAFDIPQKERPGGGRVAMSIGATDLTLSDYTNGIPATITASGSDIMVELPERGDGSELRALGYDTVNLGYDLAARWNEADEEILVDRLMFTGTDMGAVTLSGIVGNAGTELFATDERVAQLAAASLTIRELTIDIRNDGLAPALIALIAAEEKQKPESFHVMLAGVSRALPLALLGATPEALNLSKSLGAFLDGTPNLTITLTSVDPAGLGMAELMAAEDNPAALKGKIAITASVSGEAVPFTWPEPPAKTDATEIPEPPAPPAEGPRDGKLANSS